MNRLVSLLLVALALAAVSLAQPAQAQWVKGKPYYDSHNAAPTHDANTTVTMNPVGTVTFVSSPPGYPNTAVGSFSGNVDVDYTWTGKSTPTVGFSCTDGFAVSGSAPPYGEAASNAGNNHYGGVAGTTVGTPNNSYSLSSTPAFVYILPNNPSTTVTRSAPLGASTSDEYMGSATAGATVTFGAPIKQ